MPIEFCYNQGCIWKVVLLFRTLRPSLYFVHGLYVELISIGCYKTRTGYYMEFGACQTTTFNLTGVLCDPTVGVTGVNIYITKYLKKLPFKMMHIFFIYRVLHS